MKLIEAKNFLGVRFEVKDANGSYKLDEGDIVWLSLFDDRHPILKVLPPGSLNLEVPRYTFSALDEATWDATIELHQPWLDEMITKRDELTKRIEQAQRAGEEQQ